MKLINLRSTPIWLVKGEICLSMILPCFTNYYENKLVEECEQESLSFNHLSFLIHYHL